MEGGHFFYNSVHIHQLTQSLFDLETCLLNVFVNDSMLTFGYKMKIDINRIFV